MLIVAKKKPTEKDIRAWLATLPGFIEGNTLRDGKPTVLYKYQIACMNNHTPFQIYNKARQVGMSFTMAAECLARTHIQSDTTSTFVSINQEESMEKITYAKALYQSLPAGWQKKIITDNKTEICFEDTGGKTVSRILSHPQRPVRGKKSHIYLDEFAHYQVDEEIYTSALPSISRGDLYMKILSTPLGKAGKFHTIFSEGAKYPNFQRITIPWWECPEFCVDVNKALNDVKSTSDMVAVYGTDRMKMIFENMELLDFEQEYCCAFNDESTAYFPYDLILPCTMPADEIPTHDSIANLANCATGLLVAGVDIGRKHDATEFFILEKIGEVTRLRYTKTMHGVSFEAQRAELREAMDKLPNLRMALDATGMGCQLAEEMKKKYFSRVEEVTFTNDVKESLITNLKIFFERKAIIIPNNRELIQQIHSIKRTMLQGGRIRYDAERTEKHHADKTWALALAASLLSKPQSGQGFMQYYKELVEGKDA